MASETRRSSCKSFVMLILCMISYSTKAEDADMIKSLNEKINGELYDGFFKDKKCCSAGTNVIEVIREMNPKTKRQEERIVCSDGNLQNEKIQDDCPDGSFQEILLESDLYSITPQNKQLEIKNKCDSTESPTIIKAENKNYCIGLKHLYDIDDDDDYDDEEDEENLYTDADAPELSSANNDSCSVTPSISKNYTIILKYCNLPCGHPSNLQSPMCL